MHIHELAKEFIVSCSGVKKTRLKHINRW